MDDREARTCAFLSGRLSPPFVRVVVATYGDLDRSFFDGRGYVQTLSQLTGAQPRTHYTHVNSQRLLELTDEMLTHGCGIATAHALCCAMNVPVYHLLKVVSNQDTQVKLVDKFGHRTALGTKYVKHAGEYRRFALYKKSRERSGWWRHAYEAHCLCAILTSDFTVRVAGNNPGFRPSNPELYRRIQRLLEDGFGIKTYKTVLGEAITEAAYLAYGTLTRPEDELGDQFRYNLRPCKTPRRCVEVVNEAVTDSFKWFLQGKHEPVDAPVKAVETTPADLSPRFKTLVFPALEATMHVNIQVAHAKMLSKERMMHSVSGKSLVFTVVKKKTLACSSYKAVEADWCVPTCNSLNFNIQGYDLSVMTAQVLLQKFSRVCSVDDMEPLVVSHARYSTHSFQNGVQDTNSYRLRVVENNPATCSKVPHFPVVKMVNAGLLHRESCLINVKPGVEEVAETIHGVIADAAEIDREMATLVYGLETEANELLDNQVLGIVKTAYLFGRKEAAKAVLKVLVCDRLLVGLNPKTTKSEFADKSKFDSESKGKASKKIKTADKTKDRQGFLDDLNSAFPDVYIDHFNSNSRGKWSFADRMNHSPDWIFYSPFTLATLDALRETYPRDDFPSFNRMTDEMRRECVK